MTSLNKEIFEDGNKQNRQMIFNDKRKKMRKTKRCHQKRKKVLTLPCPAHYCQKPVQLLCPFCQHGALVCDEQFFILTCEHCHHALHNFPCPHCDFPVGASYVQKKQKTLRKLKENADGSKFLAVIITFLSATFFIWAIIRLYA